MKKVYGSYLNAGQARRAVDELLEQGFTCDEIKVVSDNDLSGELNYTQDNIEKDDRNLWEKIKDAFTFDKYHDNYWDKGLDDDQRTYLQPYKENLKAGEILVLVEDRIGQHAMKE